MSYIMYHVSDIINIYIRSYQIISYHNSSIMYLRRCLLPFIKTNSSIWRRSAMSSLMLASSALTSCNQDSQAGSKGDQNQTYVLPYVVPCVVPPGSLFSLGPLEKLRNKMGSKDLSFTCW